MNLSPNTSAWEDQIKIIISSQLVSSNVHWIKKISFLMFFGWSSRMFLNFFHPGIFQYFMQRPRINFQHDKREFHFDLQIRVNDECLRKKLVQFFNLGFPSEGKFEHGREFQFFISRKTFPPQKYNFFLSSPPFCPPNQTAFFASLLFFTLSFSWSFSHSFPHRLAS